MALGPPPISRTNPTKLVTPPMLRSPSVRAANSAPTSKSSAWTRIAMSFSAPRHRREERHLVTGRQGVTRPDIFLIDRDTHHGRVLQRIGEVGAACLEPADEGGYVADFGRRRHFFLGDPDL